MHRACIGYATCVTAAAASTAASATDVTADDVTADATADVTAVFWLLEPGLLPLCR
jgi:hypothetical protein